MWPVDVVVEPVRQILLHTWSFPPVAPPKRTAALWWTGCERRRLTKASEVFPLVGMYYVQGKGQKQTGRVEGLRG